MARSKRDRTKSSDFGPMGQESVRNEDFESALVKMAEPRSKRGHAVARLVVYGTLTAMLALPLLNMITINNTRNLSGELASMVRTQYNPSYKVRYADLGRQVIESWYNGGQPPLDLARGVSWPTSISGGRDPIQAYVEDASNDDSSLTVTDIAFFSGEMMPIPGTDNGYQEALKYTAHINGIRYEVNVAIAIPDLDDYDAIPVLTAAPTIDQPMLAATSELTGAPSGYSNVSLGASAQEQLFAWAEAWTRDERSVLKQIAKDPADENVYVGLSGGWRYVSNSASILWAYRDGDRVMVQMEWDMKVPDMVMPDPEDRDREITITGPTQKQRMDLLVEDWDTALPAVVAWGPAGSYESLEPGMNVMSQEDAGMSVQGDEDEEDDAPSTDDDSSDQEGE